MMHCYVGISVMWGDLGSCPVICPVSDNRDKKSFKDLCGCKKAELGILQKIISQSNLAVGVLMNSVNQHWSQAH